MKPVLRVLRALATAVAPTVGAALVRALGATMRLKVDGFDDDREGVEARILAFWHDQLLALILGLIGRGVPYTALVSRHPDAEPIARTVTRLGLHVVRGSSTRGGLEALAGLVAALKEGKSVVFTPDGPRGPRHRAGDGAIVLARRAGIRIVPVGCAARPRVTAGSWDRLQVPLPFARIAVVEGPPIRMAGVTTRAQRAEATERLQRALDAATERAEAVAG